MRTFDFPSIEMRPGDTLEFCQTLFRVGPFKDHPTGKKRCFALTETRSETLWGVVVYPDEPGRYVLYNTNMAIKSPKEQ